MSNKYRTATLTRRGARLGFPEHDDFEGLPVRQWRQEWVNVPTVPPTDPSQQDDVWDAELFFGMPKDTPLLPSHTQTLLRAARSGRLYKRPAPLDDDDYDDEGVGTRKEVEPAAEGFMVKTWKQMPGNAESPTVSHLAKRHKNTVTLPSKSVLAQIQGPTAARHKVRRIDAAGNPYEQTVTVTDGQKVDGEIISTTIVPLHQPNPETGGQPRATPARRRPPPPKRKPKGPGRGRKKGRLPLVPAPAAVQQPTAEGSTSEVKNEDGGLDEQAVKMEDNDDSANQDSEMADNSAVASEDEYGDGDDDGAETPDIENADHDMDDSEASEVIRPSSIEEPDESRRSTSEEEITMPKVRFQPPGLSNLGPPLGPLRLSSPRLEGSPLKNVIIQSPTDRSPLVSPRGAAGSFTAGSSYMDAHAHSSAVLDHAPNVVRGLFASETASPGISSDASASQAQDSEMFPPVTAAESNRDIANPGDSVDPDVPEAPIPDQQSEALVATVESPIKQPPSAALDDVQQKKDSTPVTPLIKAEKVDTPVAIDEAIKSEPESQPSGPEVAHAPKPPTDSPGSSTSQPPATKAKEDLGMSLLGSLERELDRQEDSLSRSGSAVGTAKGEEEAAAVRTSSSQSPVLNVPSSEGELPAIVETVVEAPAVEKATASAPPPVDAAVEPEASPLVGAGGDVDTAMVDAPLPDVPAVATSVSDGKEEASATDADAAAGVGQAVKEEEEKL